MIQNVIQLLTKYRETLLYLFFGGATFVVSVLSYGLLSAEMHFDYSSAYIISWFVAVLFAYLTNRIWVFQSKVHKTRELIQEIWQFYLARIITGIIGWFILAFGVKVLQQNDLLWNGIQNIFVIGSNYVLSKMFIFKKS
ncbi:GtrA family protein [Fructobacillus ficulneus]|uniref:Teichoic acid glycosylation protein n=1 Tax=Fructobacillus ficulneus TaxID=157463 RepID=A0A0K8MF16_9LACO|nr:GtrA family protein [Fructobacillus ficulneus]GAO99115.1 teichoic acid glycosylation protein [Fructobacillus ficulneus]